MAIIFNLRLGKKEELISDYCCGKTQLVERFSVPPNSMKILLILVIVAAVANLPLAMANVALPSSCNNPISRRIT